MASVQVPPAVQHPGSAIPAGMTQQQAQEVFMVSPTPSLPLTSISMNSIFYIPTCLCTYPRYLVAVFSNTLCRDFSK